MNWKPLLVSSLISVIYITSIFAQEYPALDIPKNEPTFTPLKEVKVRPDMVVLLPNGGFVFVYRDKYGGVIGEEYYTNKIYDSGVGLCGDMGKGDMWLFTGGGYLLHKESDFPNGIEPYWRNLSHDESYLYNNRANRPKK